MIIFWEYCQKWCVIWRKLTLVTKVIWWIYNIFAFLCIFDGFLNLCVVFFWECLPIPVAMPELSNWSASKSWQELIKKTPKFNKTAACSQRSPLGHPAPSLSHWYTGLYLQIFDPGPSNPTTFLELCSLVEHRQSIESPMGVLSFNSTEKAHTLTIYDYILRILLKRCVIWRKLTFLQNKMMNLQYFCIHMYIWKLLKFLVGVFLWKAYQTLVPCQNFSTGQTARLGKYYQQTIQYL